VDVVIVIVTMNAIVAVSAAATAADENLVLHGIRLLPIVDV